MESTFTPIQGLVGGLLIGLAATTLLLADGKIAGISGIVGRALPPKSGDLAWRVAFLAGLPLGSWSMARLRHGETSLDLTTSFPLLVVAGLLVGFGTQLGNGCTSGHGVCGLARRSRRSAFATATFMSAGAATVFVVRHVFGGS
jgi:uncharacterized membrane protein YedE/YeeE